MVPRRNTNGGSSSDIYDISDREKDKKKLRARQQQQNKEMAETEDPSSRLAAHIKPQQRIAMADSRQKRDEALGRLENLTSTTDAAAASSDGPAIPSPAVETGRRAEVATTRRGRATDASGLDLDDDMFGNLDSSFDDGDEAPNKGTRSADTSSFNVALFKRRPRQSSIVGRDDAPIRPSSRGPNTPMMSSAINFSVFKRRAREPSILGTAQKDRQQRACSQASSRVSGRDQSDNSEDDEADLAPDAESTPLDRRQTRSTATRSSARVAQRVSSANSRKRKSSEGHDRRSKRRALGQDDSIEDDDIRDSIEDEGIRDSVEVTSSSPQSEPREAPMPSTPNTNVDDTALAPPASSGSSNGTADVWPSLKSLARNHNSRRHVSRAAKTPGPDDDASDISSPPSLTHSPDYRDDAKHKRKGKGKLRGHREPSPKVTTADLASLLPQRRRKQAQNDPYDVGSSDREMDTADLGDDDDELTHARARASRPRRAASSAKRATTNVSAAPTKGRRSPAPVAPGKRSRRTYGSRSFNTSDKENEAEDTIVVGGEGEEGEESMFAPLDDDAFDGTATTLTEGVMAAEELRMAARKFKEVDKWVLDFEEVTEPSSPRDAR